MERVVFDTDQDRAAVLEPLVGFAGRTQSEAPLRIAVTAEEVGDEPPASSK